MIVTTNIQTELKTLIEDAYRVSQDTGQILESILEEAINHPLSKNEAEEFLTKIIIRLQLNVEQEGNTKLSKALGKELNNIIQQAIEIRENMIQETYEATETKKVVNLFAFKGKQTGPVLPTPTFYRREIPMNCGGVKTRDISLWEGNERLDIHIGQFISANGREPESQELLDIMLSKMPLPGLVGDDEFKIVDLARSIADNGVRTPPIISLNGTLLDGNRRVAACYYILHSNDFSSEQRKRAEEIFVWQLTEHATTEDEESVVVSLNFEPPTKEPWPDYVKARIIFTAWEALLAREANLPSPARVTELRKELADRYGYGKDTSVVSRYTKMVEWADEFEKFMVSEKHKDEYEVKHQANRRFQYFDELSRGASNGVAHTLNQDEPFKHLVYELLFQDKIKNWNIIRNLKFYNPDVVDAMIKARDLPDIETAQDLIEEKLTEAKAQTKEARIGNPNQRIEVFSKWLEQVPISAFRDVITKDNLMRLHKAFQLVENQISSMGITD